MQPVLYRNLDIALPFLPSFQTTPWDILSVIIFPIGICRTINYLFAKYLISQLVLPSSIQTIEMGRIVRNYLTQVQDSDLAEEVLSHPNLLEAKTIRVTTEDHVSLDGIEIIAKAQSNLPSSEQKWLIFALPNHSIWQQFCHFLLLPLADTLKINVLSVNYRMTGLSERVRPRFFQDLCHDVDGAVSYLLGKNVPPEHILMHGFSLGGATGLHTAAKYQSNNHEMPVVAQNTFSQISKVAPEAFDRILASIDSSRATTLLEQLGETSFCSTLLFSLRDALLSLPHLIFRVSYLALAIFGNLLFGEFQKVQEDICEIGKTLVIDTVITLSAILSIVSSPCTSMFSQLNASLNRHFYDHSTFKRFLQSYTARAIIEFLLAQTAWNINNEKAAKKIKKLLVIYAPKDDLIYGPASLASVVPPGIVEALPETDGSRPIDHSDIAVPFNEDSNIQEQRAHFTYADRRLSHFINEHLCLS